MAIITADVAQPGAFRHASWNGTIDAYLSEALASVRSHCWRRLAGEPDLGSRCRPGRRQRTATMVSSARFRAEINRIDRHRWLGDGAGRRCRDPLGTSFPLDLEETRWSSSLTLQMSCSTGSDF